MSGGQDLRATASPNGRNQLKVSQDLFTELFSTCEIDSVNDLLAPHSSWISSSFQAVFCYLHRFLDLLCLWLAFTHCRHQMNHSVVYFPSSAYVACYHTPIKTWSSWLWNTLKLFSQLTIEESLETWADAWRVWNQKNLEHCIHPSHRIQMACQRCTFFVRTSVSTKINDQLRKIRLVKLTV